VRERRGRLWGKLWGLSFLENSCRTRRMSRAKMDINHENRNGKRNYTCVRFMERLHKRRIVQWRQVTLSASIESISHEGRFKGVSYLSYAGIVRSTPPPHDVCMIIQISFMWGIVGKWIKWIGFVQLTSGQILSGFHLSYWWLQDGNVFSYVRASKRYIARSKWYTGEWEFDAQR
jgi:uncharacterized membrane protein